VRVVHLSTYDITGGAARAAYRLHVGLQRVGHQSQLFVDTRHSHDHTVVAFTPSMSVKARLQRRIRRERIALDFRTYRRSRPSGLGADVGEENRECVEEDAVARRDGEAEHDQDAAPPGVGRQPGQRRLLALLRIGFNHAADSLADGAPRRLPVAH
jgi:hypothetical protein